MVSCLFGFFFPHQSIVPRTSTTQKWKQSWGQTTPPTNKVNSGEKTKETFFLDTYYNSHIVHNSFLIFMLIIIRSGQEKTINRKIYIMITVIFNSLHSLFVRIHLDTVSITDVSAQHIQLLLRKVYIPWVLYKPRVYIQLKSGATT